jgi:hypothetical protein
MADHLSIYLSDHAAASVAMLELAKRSRENNKGTELGDYLSRTIARLENEHSALEHFIQQMDGSESTLKNIAAWGAEKLGRLKLNDAVLRYSELSRIVELEGLIAAAEIKIIMWTALKAHAAQDPGFSGPDMDRFINETQTMKENLKGYHQAAAHTAFSEK